MQMMKTAFWEGLKQIVEFWFFYLIKMCHDFIYLIDILQV